LHLFTESAVDKALLRSFPLAYAPVVDFYVAGKPDLVTGENGKPIKWARAGARHQPVQLPAQPGGPQGGPGVEL
jgi:hypothetical protein